MVNRAFKGALLILAGAWSGIPVASAQSDFQFGYANEASFFKEFTIDCNRGGPDSRCALGGNTAAYTDPTPFLQEIVILEDGTYYHSVVGDPASDFAQEVYIKLGGCCYSNRFPLSSSEAPYGGGNPTRVVMTNMIKDGEITQMFVKDSLAFKPLTSQTVANADIRMDFVVDMSAINYGTLDVAGDVSNRLELLTDAQLETGNYDNNAIPSFFSDKSVVNQMVNAGRYTYTPGDGNGGSDGVYTYWDGGYDEYLADQNLFRRDDQNVGYQVLPTP